MDSSLEASKGRVGLSTELTLNAEEFDAYDLQDPVTIAFHLRELNATIAFAESLGTTLDIHFTEPAAPLCIDVEGLSIEGLFVISTIQVPGENHVTMSQTTATANGVKKREREETPYESARFKKSMKVVHTTPLPSGSRSSASVRGQSVMSAQPPASLPRAASFFADRPNAQSTPRDMPPPPLPIRGEYAPPPPARREESEEPLFLPASSQLSQAEVEVLRSTGLGIENMDAEEFANMLEGDGEEVAFDLSQPNFALQASQTDPGTEEINMEFISTQSSGDSESKDFHPLFED
ncbi:hypothetical protein CC1G_03214 [Coprinopsis cinerea okayama7|uniref:Cell cycle checkpoint control protein RAD9A n=1 Tax=Coprinopsis cinerea (strain Okayama-7 / 130 / ATCC MYA-4618 / FGSC 9003) TaxID=240176 RepID=A8N771_COPC7|nr:hypothetical protein CC1G_03214 [Coprinopsis cinerea okayama7\|eukprot:XP_001830677.2 hypothetical protein CC1G_03214 [Coprinopsis cinerea okayama7\